MGKFSTRERFTESGSFLPDEGVYTAKIAGIVDQGEVETSFGMKEKVLFLFVLDAVMENGEPFTVRSSYNWVLNPKSNLFELVSKVLGKKTLEPEEIEDLEILLGRVVDIEVVHSAKTADGKVYANIGAVLKARGKGPDLEGYVFPEYFVTKYGEDAISLADGVVFPGEEPAPRAAAPKSTPKTAAPAPRAAAPKTKAAPAPALEPEDDGLDEGEDGTQGEQEPAPAPAPAPTGRPARPRAFGNRG